VVRLHHLVLNGDVLPNEQVGVAVIDLCHNEERLPNRNAYVKIIFNVAHVRHPAHFLVALPASHQPSARAWQSQPQVPLPAIGFPFVPP
jgi:hypothetical protein